MTILWLLIAVSLGMACIGLASFFWAVNGGQFDDLQSPGERIVADETLDDARRKQWQSRE